MAKLEISIPYKTLSKQKAFALGAAWAALGLVMAFLLVHCVTAIPILNVLPAFAKHLVLLLVAVTSAAAYTYLPFRVAVACLQGGRFSANQEGLGIPGSIFHESRWLPWSQLKLAQNHDGKIDMKFAPGGTVSLDSRKLSDADLEQFLLAIEVWGQRGIFADSLIEMRDNLQNKKTGIESHSYTQVWEEELNRRFNSTTFIPLEPGHTLRSNSFTVIRQLAFGGFSAVYLAEDSSRQQVVIKESVSDINDETHAKALEFFKREALLLSNLKHERIAHVLDNFIENGRNYLVLEYIPGDNLREYVRKHGPLQEHFVLELMNQMVDVLCYLHEHDPPIMHRDFTPDNIVLQPDRTIIVIDFGAANEYLGTATGTLIGKQCYMPPEQVRGKSGPQTDLYALGCTASFLLCGRDPEALSVCHPRAENSHISIETDELISQLTQQDNKKRVSSARQLKGILQKATLPNQAIISPNQRV